jgi:hypothetical protein
VQTRFMGSGELLRRGSGRTPHIATTGCLGGLNLGGGGLISFW